MKNKKKTQSRARSLKRAPVLPRAPKVVVDSGTNKSLLVILEDTIVALTEAPTVFSYLIAPSTFARNTQYAAVFDMVRLKKLKILWMPTGGIVAPGEMAMAMDYSYTADPATVEAIIRMSEHRHDRVYQPMMLEWSKKSPSDELFVPAGTATSFNHITPLALVLKTLGTSSVFAGRMKILATLEYKMSK